MLSITPKQKMNMESKSLFRISKLLDLRDKKLPKRGKTYFELQRVIDEFINFLFLQLKKKSWKEKMIKRKVKKKLTEASPFLEQPFFICGAMKSRTTLLLNLLDSEVILAMSGDSHYIKNNFNKYSYKNLAFYWIKRLINPTGYLPFWFLKKDTKNYISLLVFLRYFYNRLKDKFLAVVITIYYVLSENKKHKFLKWAEKTPHNELWAVSLKINFLKQNLLIF